MNLKNIPSSFYREPWVITSAGFLDVIEKIDAIPLHDKEEEQEAPDPAKLRASYYKDPSYWYLRDDGIAVLPIRGGMTHKSDYYGVMSYNSILADYKEAHAREDVKGIALEFDTPGGEGSGIADMVNEIYSIKEKPTWSFINKNALSGGQWISPVADEGRVYITESGRAGSVGVWTAHENISGMLEKLGVDITLISSGKHKVDGHPFAALPDEVREEIQEGVHQTRQDFASAVAELRGMEKIHVLNTEAQVYRGQEAVDIGFADHVIKEQDFYGEFSNFLENKPSGAAHSTTTEVDMTDKEKGSVDNKAAPDDNVEALVQEAYDNGKNDGIAEGKESARTDAVEAVITVLSHENAEGKTQRALTLLKDGHSCDTVVKLLPALMPDDNQASTVENKEEKEEIAEADDQVLSVVQAAVSNTTPIINNESDNNENDDESPVQKSLKTEMSRAMSAIGHGSRKNKRAS